MSPITFLKEVREELSKVTWPSKEEVIEATAGIVIFCIVVAVYFWALDFVFSELLKLIIEK